MIRALPTFKYRYPIACFYGILPGKLFWIVSDGVFAAETIYSLHSMLRLQKAEAILVRHLPLGDVISSIQMIVVRFTLEYSIVNAHPHTAPKVNVLKMREI